MQITTKVIDTANASISAKIPSAEVKSKLENLAKKAAKNMKIDGFRAGKVPVNVVLKRYKKAFFFRYPLYEGVRDLC